MNKDVKEKWLAALPEFEQAQGQLGVAGTNRRCCLGVLCEVAVREGIIPPPTETGTSVVYGAEEDYGGSELVLPSQVMAWAGIDEASPLVYVVDPDSPDGTREVDITYLNDGEEEDYVNEEEDDVKWRIEPQSFEQIAVVIREQL